jgi:hypothetical protein
LIKLDDLLSAFDRLQVGRLAPIEQTTRTLADAVAIFKVCPTIPPPPSVWRS